MRELKILVVVVFFTGVLYWGVEPFAHSQMHPHVDAPDYTFNDVDAGDNLTYTATLSDDRILTEWFS